MIHTSIRMDAYNTAMSLAREILTNTGYARASQEAHALMRQALNQGGDIDTTAPGFLTITVDPLPTKAKTLAIAQLVTTRNIVYTRAHHIAYKRTHDIFYTWRQHIADNQTYLIADTTCAGCPVRI